MRSSVPTEEVKLPEMLQLTSKNYKKA